MTAPPPDPAGLEALQAQVADAAPVGHLVTDADDVVLTTDPALRRWLGGDPTAGTRFADLLPAGQRVVWRTHHLPRLEEAGRLAGVVLDIVGPDATLPVLLTAHMLTTATGARAVGITLVEATERRGYERDLLVARRAAEDAERRLRLLHRVSEACARGGTSETLLARVAATLEDWLAVDDVSVRLSDDPAFGATLGGAALASLERGSAVVAQDATDGHGDRLLLPFVHDGHLRGVAVAGLVGPWRGDDRDLLDLQHAGSLVGQALERARLEERLERLATTDALTGLANRRTLTERLDRALDRAGRNRTWLALVFIDLDGFKAINDSLGHAAGDGALLAAAERVSSAVRAADTVARIGGDEFVVLLEGAAPGVVEALVDRIHAALGAPCSVGGHPLRLRASIGTALHSPEDPPQAPDALLARADEAMYVAKASRRPRAATQR